MDKTPPWTLYPPLTQSRLSSIARLIADVRHETVLLHQETSGDNNWSLGCRVYARTCYALLSAVDVWPEWLSVVEDTGLHFVFAIGGVPLRFYKGEPDNAPVRSLRRNYPEIRAHQMALFGESQDRADEILRFAVETDEFGEAETITLVQLDMDGATLDSWPIEFTFATGVSSIEKPKEGVKQAPAKVLPFKEEKKEEDENA